jgi:hypothetical protein
MIGRYGEEGTNGVPEEEPIVAHLGDDVCRLHECRRGFGGRRMAASVPGSVLGREFGQINSSGCSVSNSQNEASGVLLSPNVSVPMTAIHRNRKSNNSVAVGGRKFVCPKATEQQSKITNPTMYLMAFPQGRGTINILRQEARAKKNPAAA